jgi:adenosylhomocysteine nucleosidase
VVDPPSSHATALLVAMPGELGALRERAVSERSVQGLRLLELDLPGGVLACVGGIGKVNAARAATILIAEARPRRFLIAGVCGGLRKHLVPGTLVHCDRAIQTDLAVREGREVAADPELREAWSLEMPGTTGAFLTADRPVLSRWRRLRLARAFAGDCVADMETAAAAAVCRAAGVPWAALRTVTDGAGAAALLSFRKHYPSQGGRAADSVQGLLERIGPAQP